MIPFTIQTPSSTSDPILLREKTTLRPFQNNGDWFKINVGQAVPCRVMYPSQVIETLSSKLLENPSIISGLIFIVNFFFLKKRINSNIYCRC